jgi:hypothetical protein
MKNWYFTFGSNHVGVIDGPLHQKYMKVQANSFGEARDIIWPITNACFAFQYSEDDKATAIDRWNLQEVQLQEVHRA